MPGKRRVEHELVKDGLVADGVLDRRVDVSRGMVLQADDRRAQHARAVRLEPADQGPRVGAVELRVAAVVALQAQPDPGQPQPHKLLGAVGVQRAGGAEHVEGPCLVVPLHELQEPQGPHPIQQEVLVHHEERLDLQVGFELAHDVEQLVARLVEADRLPLAAEHRRGGAEVAAHGAADRGNDRCGHVGAVLRGGYAHGPRAVSGDDLRVADGLLGVFAQERAEPADPLAPHDVVGVDSPGEVGNVGDVPAHDDFRLGKMLANQLAHLLDLEKIRHDAADADDVVAPAANLLDKAVQRRDSPAAYTARRGWPG